jgi:hypothetical protein
MVKENSEEQRARSMEGKTKNALAVAEKKKLPPTHREVSSEPQPLLRRSQPAPKSQWVMLVALKDTGSGWRGVMRLLQK